MTAHHCEETSPSTRPPLEPTAAERHFRVSVICVIGIALLLRFYRIDAFELWLDEAYTFRQMVISDWLPSYLADNSPPFYNLLMRAWGYFAGYSELALRAPSAIFGGAFAGLVMVAGRTFFDRRTGYWCGAIAALSPIHLYYSQEARNYTLMLLLLLCTWLLLWRAQSSETWRNWGGAALCALLALFTHYLAALALLPTLLLVCFWPEPLSRRRRLRRYLLLTTPLVALVGLWMAWSFLITPHSMTGFSWMTSIWQVTPPILAPLRSVEAFGFLTGPHVLQKMGGFTNYDDYLGEGLRLGLRLLSALLLLWVCLPFGDRALHLPDLGRRKFLLLGAFLLPLLTLWATTIFRPLYIVSRYDLIAYPPFVILTGLAIAKLQAQGRPGFWSGLLLGGLCLLPIGTFLLEFYQTPPPRWHQPTAQLLSDNVREGDVVVFTGNRSFVTRYYLNRIGYHCEQNLCENAARGHRFIYRQYPMANEEEEAVYNRTEIMENPMRAREELMDFLSMRSGPAARLWLVVRGEMNGKDRLITVRHRPDEILLRTILEINLSCRVTSEALFVLACDTPH